MRFDTTARDQQVLTFIRDSITRLQRPPSISEIADHLDADRTVAKRALARLVRDGEIEVDPGVARGIRIRRSTTHVKTEDL